MFNQPDRRVQQRCAFLVSMEQNCCCLNNWNLHFLSLTLRNNTKLERKGFSYNAHCTKEEENDHEATASRHGFKSLILQNDFNVVFLHLKNNKNGAKWNEIKQVFLHTCKYPFWMKVHFLRLRKRQRQAWSEFNPQQRHTQCKRIRDGQTIFFTGGNSFMVKKS